MPRPLSLATLGLAACTAGWNSQVRYSNEPAPVGQSLIEGVYTAVLRSYLDVDRDTVVILDPSSLGEEPFPSPGTTQLPSEWADTLQQQVQAAASDSGRTPVPPRPPLLAAARQLGIRFVPPGTLAEAPPGVRPLPRLAISKPGFNDDSTIAVLDVSVHCGPLCGSGQTLYLARRPGLAWRIWRHELVWVS